ncbi:putative protein [Arabidopsis thaliana]|uniref:Uncharacterized protein T32A11_30 n=1 Tax=Arabidopsis thaliana TaxID=3702 RepID=Q9M1N0_ARATH|nr:putative protein [Arabidopsis thaliana]
MVNYHLLNELSPQITGWTGTGIEVTIHRRFSAFYFDKIFENKWIGLTNFKVIPNSDPVKTTSAEYGINLMDKTVVTSGDPNTPIKFNNFTSFDNILEGTFENDQLVDLLGAVIEVGILSHSGDPDVGVEEMATGRKALEFDTCYRGFGHPKIVVALAWWRVVRESELVGGRKNKVKIVRYGAVST